MPLLRLQVLAPAPPNHQPRSGPLIVDLHSICVTFGPASDSPHPRRSTRFNDVSDLPHTQSWKPDGTPLASIEFGRIFLAKALPGGTKAVGLLSIGPLTSEDPVTLEEKFGISPTMSHESPLLPSIDIQSNPSPTVSRIVTTVLVVNVPSVHVTLSKPYLDSIQLWADDVAQWAERTFVGENGVERSDRSGDPSLIGSRYFARRSASGSSTNSSDIGVDPAKKAKSELVVKLTVSEGAP